MTKIYGIKNCDTVKKALTWLEVAKVQNEFLDYKKEGVDVEVLREFVKEFGWEVVINKRGTTWRKLSDQERDLVVDADSAIKIMLKNPSMIKRPLLKTEGVKLVGFDVSAYEKTFQ